ncbi:hypothetical protein [Streptomyces sp. NPDC001340]
MFLAPQLRIADVDQATVLSEVGQQAARLGELGRAGEAVCQVPSAEYAAPRSMSCRTLSRPMK